MTTITAYAAEMLAFANPGTFEGDWMKVAVQENGNTRWARNYTMILKSPDGEFWGVSYSVGATEEQENDMPWQGKSDDEPIELTRMYPRTITRVEYWPTPAEASA
ncbi:MAG: hypothetical protein ABW022_14755 [Actinoplanes sp.]